MKKIISLLLVVSIVTLCIGCKNDKVSGGKVEEVTNVQSNEDNDTKKLIEDVYAMPKNAPIKTFCNPLNLEYKFNWDNPNPPVQGQIYRETADPTVICYKGKYFIFSSKSQGYYYTDNFVSFTTVDVPKGKYLFDDGTELFNGYAPTAWIIDGILYYGMMGSRIYQTTDPTDPSLWEKVDSSASLGADPCVLVDDDGSVYMYSGLTDGSKTDDGSYIRVDKLNKYNGFNATGEPAFLFRQDMDNRGIEVSGDSNDYYARFPFNEGVWVTKYNGKYYLQYATPGTEYASYADGLFVSDKPMGPFTYEEYSPITMKSTGFIVGAGHGSTFQDANGNWWRVVTNRISMRAGFERRISVFPAEFSTDGTLSTNTLFGDYPIYFPGTEKMDSDNNRPEWNLLSYNKTAVTSSTFVYPEGEAPALNTKNYSVQNAFDENVQTWWSSESGNVGEYIQVDLKKECDVQAVQINIADHYVNTPVGQPLLTTPVRYNVEASLDGKTWKVIVDKSKQSQDLTHDYTELDEAVKARFVRVTNTEQISDGGMFSLFEFRVFGTSNSNKPVAVTDFSVARYEDDRGVLVSWTPVENADGYILRYGIAPDKLNNCYQVNNCIKYEIKSLNKGVQYYYTIEPFNDAGKTPGAKVISDTVNPQTQSVTNGKPLQVGAVNFGDGVKSIKLTLKSISNGTIDIKLANGKSLGKTDITALADVQTVLCPIKETTGVKDIILEFSASETIEIQKLLPLHIKRVYADMINFATDHTEKDEQVSKQDSFPIFGNPGWGFTKSIVTFFSAGRYIGFDNVYFDGKSDKLTIKIASIGESVVEVILDDLDTGTVIAKIETPNTGDWNMPADVTVDIKPVSGTHKLYFRVAEGGLNMVTFKFFKG